MSDTAATADQTPQPQSSGGGHEEYEDIKEQDRYLPIANVSRIMKRALPNNAKIAKEAKETVQECVSEFISFITSEASDRCQQEKRKTINGEDVLWAMQSLGFENYAEALKKYLEKYRDSVKVEKDAKDDHTSTAVGKMETGTVTTSVPNEEITSSSSLADQQLAVAMAAVTGSMPSGSGASGDISAFMNQTSDQQSNPFYGQQHQQ